MSKTQEEMDHLFRRRVSIKQREELISQARTRSCDDLKGVNLKRKRPPIDIQLLDWDSILFSLDVEKNDFQTIYETVANLDEIFGDDENLREEFGNKDLIQELSKFLNMNVVKQYFFVIDDENTASPTKKPVSAQSLEWLQSITCNLLRTLVFGIDGGIVPEYIGKETVSDLISLLDSDNDHLLTNCLGLLDIITQEQAEVLDCDSCFSKTAIILNSAVQNDLKGLSYGAFTVLSRIIPGIDVSKWEQVLDFAINLLRNPINDDEILAESLWVLSNFTENQDWEAVQLVIHMDIIGKMVDILKNRYEGDFSEPIFPVLECISEGATEEEIKEIIALGLFHSFDYQWGISNLCSKKHIITIISNISKHNSIVQLVINSGIIEKFFTDFIQDPGTFFNTSVDEINELLLKIIKDESRENILNTLKTNSINSIALQYFNAYAREFMQFNETMRETIEGVMDFCEKERVVGSENEELIEKLAKYVEDY